MALIRNLQLTRKRCRPSCDRRIDAVIPPCWWPGAGLCGSASRPVCAVRGTSLLSLLSLLLALLAAVNPAHGGNFGGVEAGIWLEVEPRPGVDVRELQAKLDLPGFGEVEVRPLPGGRFVIHTGAQPGGDAAQMQALIKLRDALGDSVRIWKTDVVGPRAAQAAQLDGLVFLLIVTGLITAFLWFLARRLYQHAS